MACNPTVQYNDFTGNGSTTQFTFTFPYDNTTDVHVRLGTYPSYTYPAYGTGATEYQVDSANPTRIIFGTAPSGPIRIFRCTPNNVLPATFQAGSSIRSSDLNNNFNQILFVSQDASIRSVDAQAVADTAYTQSNQAIATANTALSTANSAVTTANAANATANAAATAVANAVIYAPVADVSSIPGSPSNDDYIEVIDSTGIQSFSPLSGLPSGFVGAAGLTVRLRYQTNTWVWQMYFANDSETRYVKKSGDTFTGAVTLSGNPTSNLHAATKQYVDDSSDLKGGSTDRIFLETDTTVSASYTITSNKNSMAIGPLTFSSGATVTVPNNSTLVII